MRITIRPGASVGGTARVPGDKSIAHRWLLLAATARGRSELRGLPDALDVRSTARVLAAISGDRARDALEAWASEPAPPAEGDRSTTNTGEPRPTSIELEAQGRAGLRAPTETLDCGNSGTTMRLVSGVLASCSFESRLVGDESLSSRPMERVAVPLRAMGADVASTGGHAPLVVHGGPLRGIPHVVEVPSAQVKGAVLLAGLAAEGETSVIEPARTRDHTERAVEHLGGDVRVEDGRVTVGAFEHGGFSASVPGDVSSAAFLVAAAALSGRPLTVLDVGLNPTRTHLLEVLARMGVNVRTETERSELGEPVGALEVAACAGLAGTTVAEGELPLLIDEVPVLAMLAAHASGESRFSGGAELRVKESDRLGAVAGAISALGGAAAVEGDDLIVAGGGLAGGVVSSGGDHRMAMALVVAGLAARGPVTIEGMEAADVSFPGFVRTLVDLGAGIEP
ncbi:MAG: 3-phosphoshikimate 1-carboxyvinyltransferase [Actinomycetota bacterium]